MPDTHSEISPSMIHRVISCPACVKMCRGYPNASSVYADEGTIAHSMLEWSIKNHVYPTPDCPAAKKAMLFYLKHPELGETMGAMRDYISDVVGWLDAQYQEEKDTDPAAEIFSEQQVDLSDYIPAGFGTTDVTIVRTGFLHIVDLKYGKGVQVDAEENPQLRMYAIGMLDMLDPIYSIETVRMTIYQPRLGHISTSEISAAELRKWVADIVCPAVAEALSDKPHFGPSESGCRFCPARYDCKARADYYLSLNKFREKATFSNEDLAVYLDKIDGLTAWAEDMKEKAMKKIRDGEDVPGWKIVEGRSIRKWKPDTEDDIVKAAGEAGFDKALLYETHMITLSAIEKLMGKKAFASAMADYIEKPKGKDTLAPESDKRPALYMAADAATVFSGEEEDD